MRLALNNELVMLGSSFGANRLHFSPAGLLHVRPVEEPESWGGWSRNDAATSAFAGGQYGAVSAVTYFCPPPESSPGNTKPRAPFTLKRAGTAAVAAMPGMNLMPRYGLFCRLGPPPAGAFCPAAAANPSRRTNQCRSTHAPKARYQERVIQGTAQHETGAGPPMSPTPARKEAGMPITHIYPGEESM